MGQFKQKNIEALELFHYNDLNNDSYYQFCYNKVRRYLLDYRKGKYSFDALLINKLICYLDDEIKAITKEVNND